MTHRVHTCAYLVLQPRKDTDVYVKTVMSSDLMETAHVSCFLGLQSINKGLEILTLPGGGHRLASSHCKWCPDNQGGKDSLGVGNIWNLNMNH